MEKVKVNTDGSIKFKIGDSIPTTTKRFKQSPEIEAFYRFVLDNDLREEALAILTVIEKHRQHLKMSSKTTVRKKNK